MVDGIERSFRLGSLSVFSPSRKSEDANSETALYSGVPEIIFHPNPKIDAAKIKIASFANNLQALPMARNDDRLAPFATTLSLGFSNEATELGSCVGHLLNNDLSLSRDHGGAGFNIGLLCYESPSDGSPSIDVQTGRVIGVKTVGENNSPTLDWQIPARRYLEF
jgi:hypothetical protein